MERLMVELSATMLLDSAKVGVQQEPCIEENGIDEIYLFSFYCVFGFSFGVSRV